MDNAIFVSTGRPGHLKCSSRWRVYRIEYSPEAESQLRSLTVRQQRTLIDGVEAVGRRTTPGNQTAKTDASCPVGLWELRIGALRVYYDVVGGAEPLVNVRAVGVKERNLVRIGKDVIQP